MNNLHLGVIGTAVVGLLGIIACALTHTPIPEGLTTAATTAVGALAGITIPANIVTAVKGLAADAEAPSTHP